MALEPQVRAQTAGSVIVGLACAGWNLAAKNRLVLASPWGAVGIRGFAVVHPSGSWHSRPVFSIVMVNPSPEEVEVGQHPLSAKER